MNTIRYTHRIDTGSSAIAALYFDNDTYDLWVEFHNGTVVHRAYRYGIDTLLADLDDYYGLSLGTMWNIYLKDMGSQYSSQNVSDVQFVDRATLVGAVTPQADTSDVSENGDEDIASISLAIDFPGLSLLDIAKVVDALDAAGIKHRVQGGEAW